MGLADSITKSTQKHSFKIFNTIFLSATQLRRTNLNVTFISALPIHFIALSEMLTKTPLPAAHVNS